MKTTMEPNMQALSAALDLGVDVKGELLVSAIIEDRPENRIARAVKKRPVLAYTAAFVLAMLTMWVSVFVVNFTGVQYPKMMTPWNINLTRIQSGWTKAYVTALAWGPVEKTGVTFWGNHYVQKTVGGKVCRLYLNNPKAEWVVQ